MKTIDKLEILERNKLHRLITEENILQVRRCGACACSKQRAAVAEQVPAHCTLFRLEATRGHCLVHVEQACQYVNNMVRCRRATTRSLQHSTVPFRASTTCISSWSIAPAASSTSCCTRRRATASKRRTCSSTRPRSSSHCRCARAQARCRACSQRPHCLLCCTLLGAVTASFHSLLRSPRLGSQHLADAHRHLASR